jgi:hypothetical protein
MVAASGSSGPAISVLNSAWRPPMRSRGSTARNSTMMPTPPIQAENCRHIAIDREIPSMFCRTLAPVVEKPDIDSKSASIGFESCCSMNR